MTAESVQDAITRAAHLIEQAQHIVAFTGAGISTPSGIPDYRSPSSGLWENVDPVAVASIFGFRQNPKAFYDWVRPLTRLTVEANPNAAHIALAELENRGKLKAVITQNIDMLHTRAGSKTVHELHGHMRESTCIHCFTVYPGEPILEKFLRDGEVPLCEKCGGVLKPNVILYGEQLPIRELQAAKSAARECDLMIIAGTSLEVAPASDLPVIAQRTGARLIIINFEETPLDRAAEVIIQGDVAEVLPAIVAQLETNV